MKLRYRHDPLIAFDDPVGIHDHPLPPGSACYYVPKTYHGTAEQPCECANCWNVGQHYADRMKERKLNP